jgi:hypothetical protein
MTTFKPTSYEPVEEEVEEPVKEFKPVSTKPLAEARPERQKYYDPGMGLNPNLARSMQLLQGDPAKPAPKTAKQIKLDDESFVEGARYYDEKTEGAATYKGGGKWDRLTPGRHKGKSYAGSALGLALMTNPLTLPAGIAKNVYEAIQGPSDYEYLKEGEEGGVGPRKFSYESTGREMSQFSPTHKIDKATGEMEEMSHPAYIGTGLALTALTGGLLPTAGSIADAVLAEFTVGTSSLGSSLGKKMLKSSAAQSVKKVGEEVAGRVGEKITKIANMPPFARKAKIKDIIYDDIANVAEGAEKASIKKTAARLNSQDKELAERQAKTWEKTKKTLGRYLWDDTVQIRKALTDAAQVAKRKIKSGIAPKAELEAMEAIERTAQNATELRVLQRGASNESLRIMKELDKNIFNDLKVIEADMLGKIRTAKREIEISGREIRTKIGQEVKKISPTELHRHAMQYKSFEKYWESNLPFLFGKNREQARGIWNEANIIKKHKPEYIKTAGESGDNQIFLKNFQKAKPELYDKLIKKSDQIQEVYNSQLKQALDEGLVTTKDYTDMLAKGEHFNPRLILERIDPVMQGKRGSVGSRSGMEYLATGSKKAMMEDPRYLLNEYVGKMQSSIFRNRANKALLEFSETDGAGNIIRRLGKGEKATPSEDVVKALVDGEEIQMALPKELAEEWNGLDPLMKQSHLDSMSKWSGTQMLKAFATGANPFFPIRNFFRDLQYIYTSPQYSAFLPKFLGEAGRDYVSVFKDAVTNKGLAKKFSELGGGFGQEGLTRAGRFKEAGTVSGKRLRQAMDFAGAAGEMSERLGRLAHMKRAMRNGLSEQSAAFVARDALDFGQGGLFSKWFNSISPYFNAGIQGTRGMYKFYKSDPKKFAWKLANLAGVATGLYVYNTKTYKEDYDKIPSYMKATNWIIMLPLTRTDKNGEEQRRYISIPKDHSQMIFTSMVDTANQAAAGHGVNEEQAFISAKNFFDAVPSAVGSPMGKSLLGYFSNLDLYRNRDIWRENAYTGKIRAEEEFFPDRTPKVYELLGKGSKAISGVLGGREGLSPERAKYAADQFLSTSNAYANFFGIGIDAMLKGMDPDDRTDFGAKVSKELGLGLLRETYRDEEKIKKAEQEEVDVNTERFIEKREFEKQFERRGTDAAISSQEDLRKKWAGRRVKAKHESAAIWDVAGRKNFALWKKMAYSKSPEATARMFHEVFKDRGDYEKQKEKAYILGSMKNFERNFGKNFNIYLNQLEEESGKAKFVPTGGPVD